ncbi:ABC transporter ATP-binding protein/permease [Clostridium estertheticum]|uniref:ABC transporter ATP-binding protein/permease n=1 Tax=Clostridium estertheticum TaxID=238834 RepID=A0AA47EEG8_9CLOT|nr:ABC transporter ATP-binding protein [Clostridium estertheticum]MBU3153937.1 ABC transporter ATP-binding protein/permease [Clostridium estertheticum]MBU3199318.1 ABC transporter ATP-binding protein/permease [Clostridium estertheticum]WAG58526.1 ABC transporter ATP-binding protein/permease [Clostridium estertheticum]WAG67436.1 ABC transporter ATP-binding protein/permease [Clostridium estertheticum]
MKKLINLTKGNRVLYIVAIVSIAAATFIAMLEPLIIKITIDSVIGNKPMDVIKPLQDIIMAVGGKEVLITNLWVCALSLVTLTCIRGIFLFLSGNFSARAAENISRNMRVKLYDHIQNLPYEYHVKAESGDLIQRCTSDVETVRKFFATQMVEIGRAFFIVVFAIIMMLSLNKKMTIIAMVIVPIIFIFSYVFFYKIKSTFEKADEQEGVLTTILQENLSGVRVVKAFGRQSFEIEKYEKENKKYRDLNFKLVKLESVYWSSSDILCMTQIGLVLVSGIYFAVNGVISLGTLVVFNTYEGMLLWPVRQLGRVLTDMGKMSVSLKRISKILDTPVEREEGKALKSEIKGEMIFENVCFEYEEGNEILKDLTFKVARGETVAIVGPTGSGKSSLVHLLLRLYDYNSGSIKIDGIELKDIERKHMRSNVGIVLQEPFLYSRSIKENIKMAKIHSEDIEIYSAASVAAVHNVITTFEKGYDTVVGEKGVTLSGGQRQRVAIARTLVKDMPILIFDDSLSAVDSETDRIIRGKLKKRSENSTTFIISHRISTVMDADKIIVLNHGKIENIGTHEMLIKEEGIYKRIWEIQTNIDDFTDDAPVSYE